MKKFFVSSLAIAVALITFSFTPKDFAEGPDCENANIRWFKVAPTVNKTCNQLVQADLLLIEDITADGIPQEVPTGLPSSAPHGCLDQNTVTCAVGYVYDPLNETNDQLETVVIDGKTYFRPESDQVDDYRCCVKRPSNQ